MERKFIHIDETDSTNRWLKEQGGTDDMVVWTDYQTAGRGCGTNTWESERGKNLLFSVRCHPVSVPVSRQFLLTEAMALAVKETFDACALGHPLTIKWPNDVYWCDRKLAGTLSECSVSGQHIRCCIIGTGVNLNQLQFHSDAPNPVSIAQIQGCGMEVGVALQQVVACFDRYLEAVARGEWDDLHRAYCEALYCRQGFHAYRDKDETFEAEMVTVEADGHLLLRDRTGRLRRFAFKEVRFIT